MKPSKKSVIFYSVSAACAVLFVVLIVLIKTVDVEIVLVTGKEMGLYSLNSALFFEKNDVWYKITEILGYLAIVEILAFAALGAWQLFTRKSLKKVDRDIYAFAAVIVVLAIFYVLFEKVVVNYRPIILDAEKGAEASFPSSHTMLALTVFACGAIEAVRLVGNKKVKYSLVVTSIASAVLTVVGRLLSGVHWFTDILGGVLISACIVCAFVAFCASISRGEDADI